MNVDAALRRDDEIEQQIRAGLTGERGSDGVGGQRGSAGPVAIGSACRGPAALPAPA
jgi:hypothetical protein